MSVYYLVATGVNCVHIHTAHSLPLFRESQSRNLKRKREKERMDPVLSHKPEPPISKSKLNLCVRDLCDLCVIVCVCVCVCACACACACPSLVNFSLTFIMPVYRFWRENS